MKRKIYRQTRPEKRFNIPVMRMVLEDADIDLYIKVSKWVIGNPVEHCCSTYTTSDVWYRLTEKSIIWLRKLHTLCNKYFLGDGNSIWKVDLDGAYSKKRVEIRKQFETEIIIYGKLSTELISNINKLGSN